MRYLPLTKNARAEMLRTIGLKDVDALYKDVPKQAFIKGTAKLPAHKGELEVERIMSAHANENRAAPDGPFFLGAGTYYHHIPATVDYVIQRSEFLTAYTPYQPEIAQGTLQVIFEYQTMIARLTGQDIANASMYCGSTALAEAALMAMRVTKRSKVTIGAPLHPHYKEVLSAYLGNFEGTTLTEGEPDGETACVIVQSPDFFGTPHAYDSWRKKCDATGALLVVLVTEIVSLGLLPAPAQADIVCGEAQSLGLPMSYGGPHLGFFACKEAYLRQMPGRLCGMTKDADGRRGYVLTLSTREQHIRRDKATSNICTNQGLCALAFTVHLALLGEDGFKRLARLNHEAACKLADALAAVKGVKIENKSFFNEFVVSLPVPAEKAAKELGKRGVIAGLPLEGNRLLVAATEMTAPEDIEAFARELGKIA